MPATTPETHALFEELLYLEPDGVLSVREKGELDRHLASCAVCRDERPEIARLGAALDSSRVEVESRFTARVVSSLPEVPWETWSRSGLRTAAAVLVVLVAVSVAAGMGAGRTQAAPIGGAAMALLDLFGSALAAGAGLLAASWRGIGLALGDLFRESPVALGVFGVFVLGVDILLVRFLLRRTASGHQSTGSGPARNV